MEIAVSELQRITTLLFEHLRERGTERIDLDADYYWHVPADDIYDPNKSPQLLSVGQLAEDWDRLSKIGRGEGEPIGYALVWLSSILRYVGEHSVA